jgi:hypothetical protein
VIAERPSYADRSAITGANSEKAVVPHFQSIDSPNARVERGKVSTADHIRRLRMHLAWTHGR